MYIGNLPTDRCKVMTEKVYGVEKSLLNRVNAPNIRYILINKAKYSSDDIKLADEINDIYHRLEDSCGYIQFHYILSELKYKKPHVVYTPPSRVEIKPPRRSDLFKKEPVIYTPHTRASVTYLPRYGAVR